MSGLDLDPEKINCDCDCGATVTGTIGHLRRSPTVTCPKCGATIQVDRSDLDRGVRNVDRLRHDGPRDRAHRTVAVQANAAPDTPS